jgi:hypothetical protein
MVQLLARNGFLGQSLEFLRRRVDLLFEDNGVTQTPRRKNESLLIYS